MPSDPRDPRDPNAAAGGIPGAAPQQEAPWDGQFDRRKPTSAELAVPWLIGIILLLVGLIVLLIILLFNEEDPAIGRRAMPSSTVSVGGTTVPRSSPAPGASLAPGASPTPRPIGGPVETPRGPSPAPFAFGETELAYLARAEPLSPITLMRDDFSTDDAATVVASAAEGVRGHHWAPDGSVGVAVVAGITVILEPGAEPRRLADGVVAVAFGADARTVYAVRVRDQGETETATVIGLDVASGAERTITEVTYPNPVLTFPSSVEEAQFVDDGGPIRLVWLVDGRLALGVASGPNLSIDPVDGGQTSLDSPPSLWSPDGGLRVTVSESGDTTTLSVVDDADEPLGTATIAGAVSHVRWAPRGDRVVFTVGVGTADGGVRQDLYIWTVTGEAAPTALTANGASFGGEWLGAREFWRP